MPLSREERKLLHQKSKQPTLGVGRPDDKEGYDGDISFRQIDGSGTVEYVKQSNEWVAVASSGEMPAIRIVGGTRGAAVGAGGSSHDGLAGLGDDDHNQYLLINGTRDMTGNLGMSTHSIVLTPSDDDTVTISSATNGGLNITTVDTAAAAANIIVTADGTLDLNSVALDIDASGVVTIDGTSTISIDGADDMNFTITSSTGGEDLTIAQIGANDSSIIITAAGTGADAISIDATAGSMVIGSSLVDQKTLTLGNTSSTYLKLSPHDTIGSEKILLHNAAGDDDESIKIHSVAGGITIFSGSTMFLDADNLTIGDSDDVPVEIDATSFDLDATSWIRIDGVGVSIDSSAASNLTTSAGALTITSAAAATWSTAAGALTITSAAAASWSTAAGILTLSGNTGVNISEAGAAVIGIDTNRDVLFSQTGGSSGDPDVEIDGYFVVDGTSEFNGTVDIDGTVDVDNDTFSVDSSGAISLDSGAASNFTTSSGALTLTSAAAATWSTAAGNLTIDSAAGSLVLDGHTGAQVVSSNSGEVDITSAANVDINATTTVDIDGTAVSIDGTDDSNITVTGSNKDLAISVAGGSTQTLTISSAGTGADAIGLSASAGGITVGLGGAAGDDLIVDTTTLVVESDNNRVGIGTAAPLTLMHLNAADPVLLVKDTETGSASANARLRLAESGGSDVLGEYWDIHHSGFNLLLTRSDGTGNVVIRSSYITDHAVNSKPATNGRHFATGDADYQQNYSWIGLYDQQAAVGEHDAEFGDWGE